VISYWESGKRAPGLDDLVDLAEALERDVAYFLPRPDREPIRAVLRATAAQLEHKDLDRALEQLMDAAEAASPPAAEISVSTSRPVRAAQELLSQDGISRPPVDVEHIARRCGVTVVRGNFEDALSGAVIALDHGAVIGVNSRHAAVRQRFSIGHELGHYLLGHHDRFHIDLGSSAEHGHPPGYDWESERSANDFAAELLMPTGLVHQAYEQEESTPRLARMFEVSELAMGYRLLNLGLR